MAQAVILAGGKGTRLQERLQGRPKPLIDICGVPLLERQILLCKQYGFDRILVLVNHAADKIIEFCASKDNWGLSIECIDDGEPRGTAGAVLALLDHLDEEFLVIYGDTMIAVDLGRFWNFHKEHGADATLFLHPNDHPADSDLVSVDEQGRVTAFHPYPHPAGEFFPNLVNAALYVLRREALLPLRDLAGLQDFGKNVFPMMLGAGKYLLGYNSPEFIKDVGTPGRVDKVEALYREGYIDRASLDHPQAVVFLDRDGVINPDPGWINKPEQFELFDGVACAIRLLNHSDYRTVVVTNQPVIARGECTFEGLRKIHDKMDALLGTEGAHVDRLYFCPHHPDKGFAGEVPELKIECNCRKPGIGMLQEARKDLNADFSQSWMVGDTATDIETARKAGLKSILVETMPKNLAKARLAEPDFIKPNLLEAVRFILDEYPALELWADKMMEAVSAGGIIALGGTAHSGKSTLASALRWAAAKSGRSAVGLSLDRWILSKEDRGEGVLGRYDMAAIRQVLQAISERREAVTLNLPNYDRFTRQRIENADEITIQPRDIVIVDGVIALNAVEGIPCTKISVQSDEDLRRARFVSHYALRGTGEKEALVLYEERRRDEEPLVVQGAASADYVVKLPLGDQVDGH